MVSPGPASCFSENASETRTRSRPTAPAIAAAPSAGALNCSPPRSSRVANRPAPTVIVEPP